MIIIFHDTIKVRDILFQDKTIDKASFIGSGLTEVFFKVAHNNLEHLIIWCHYRLKRCINLSGFEKIFHHELIMASYSTTQCYSLSDDIGYVDESPFVNVKHNVNYPTWLMSSNIGGAFGKVIDKFKYLSDYNLTFSILINHISKSGQKKGLFCYSSPLLLMPSYVEVKEQKSNIFYFIKTHYRQRWLYLLLINKFIYENKIPLLLFLKAILSGRINNYSNDIDFSDINIQSKRPLEPFLFDVIIPTIGRKKYLKDVLSDLSNQTILPENVIIVEQKSDGKTDLDFLRKTTYPFQVNHVCISQLGACNARNLALEKTVSNWVFLADDDVQINENIIYKIKKAVSKYGVKAITISCLQKGEHDNVKDVVQSVNFGSGTSMVSREVLQGIRFKKEHEFGYGEDLDFGMQLRNNGVDIVYNPFVKMLHYKAPIGGFRTKMSTPWEDCNIEPKPSPTVMVYKIKHYTIKQLRGYKTTLFVKFYKHQKMKNPVAYIKKMKKRWAVSYKYAQNSIIKE